ncbi:hypothetical protein N7474_006057 [Penicillium riverlandense]|uniref:uncharacterized protein n=1 Tax=Penicillium riverlandense TaxID=1903569 RepID=UPI002547FFB5|nr:uncharacterized protein N7474_006057 [Penicillium riverlandense]KAJ5820466.1 hypothetical protein N7474_006057 [Penicillium riverlandense]
MSPLLHPVAVLAQTVTAFWSQSLPWFPGHHQQFAAHNVGQQPTTTTVAAGRTSTSTALNVSASNCFLTLPNNPLSANGLATPFVLEPPCSQSVNLQQAYVEAAVIDPATGAVSIYHPLVIDQGKTPPVAPVVPKLPANAKVALWFGFNGNVLQLLDPNGLGTHQSSILKEIDCVNGLPGMQGDVFGQVSWCNTQPFFDAANAAVKNGQLVIPPLGTDHNGATCPTTRSFEIVDACPSDNVPTQYLLLPDGATVQDTAANRAKFPNAIVINNASDEALLANMIDPAIGCTPFLGPSLDNPGDKVPALALQELQASEHQQAPIALVPLNDPDCLLTASGAVSPAKTNAYRLGINQPLLTDQGPDSGALDFYCNGMMSIAPGFLLFNEEVFAKQKSPAPSLGNNLFTFMCARYLMSLMQLGCSPNVQQPVQIATNGIGVATACTIQSAAATTTARTTKSRQVAVTSVAASSVTTTTTMLSTLVSVMKQSSTAVNQMTGALTQATTTIAAANTAKDTNYPFEASSRSMAAGRFRVGRRGQ